MPRYEKAVFSLSILAALAWLVPSQWLHAEEPPAVAAAAEEKKSDPWIRVARDDAGEPIALQTSIVHYVPAEGDRLRVSVDLVGAVHVGDRQYYEQLNEEFGQYDALLYELVAPKDAKIPKGRGTSSAHPLGAMQNGMKDLLELEHQLIWIDYTKENFVHADMTPEQFSKKMADRGEGFLQMFFRMMGQGIAQQSKQQAQGKSSDFDLLLALFAPDRARQLKVIMAQQFENSSDMLVGLGGPDGSTIITERNKVALEVLDAQIKAGKKKLGIFYGAGHMTDFDKRLREEFQLVPSETRWVTSWNLQPKQKGAK
jgi:hypothetical protein